MKGKDQKGPGRPRKNGDSASRYNKESASERSFGNDRRKFSDETPRYKKGADSEKSSRAGDRRLPAERGDSRFRKDGGSERAPRAGDRKFSSERGNPRFKREDGPEKSFGNDRARSSFQKDTPRYNKDRDFERPSRSGERKFSSERGGEPRFKREDSPERNFGNDRGRSSFQKDTPRYKKDGDFERKSRTGDRKFSFERGDSRFNREDNPGRNSGNDRSRSSFQKDTPRYKKDGEFDREPRTGDRKFSSERGASRFKREDSPERNFGSDRGRSSFQKDTPRGEFGREPRTGDRKFSSERGASHFKREEGFRPDRQKFPEENSREERGAFKTFKRKKDEPFEYGKSSKSQHRPDYSEENLIRNIPEKQRKKIEAGEKKSTDQIRLNRYIANSGLCSRREADDLIESGQITVNGKTITEMGYQVKVTDVVKYGRKILNPEKLVYVLLNKPKDFITTTEDPEGRRTVMDLVAKAGPERIYPVGRLDRATTGLLLFTNDGELAEKLSHPSHEIRKIYQVEIDKPLNSSDFEKLVEGVELEDGFIKADEVSVITPDQQVIGIEIHSGKNRVVRRIFEHLGYEVTQLDRTTYAGLTKKDLPRGNWRFLTEKEVIRLKYMI